MQDIISFAEKNGVTLLDKGRCQFCGAATERGVFECLDIFNFGFDGLDLSAQENHIYKFYIVDAHTLQHPEIHGRWSNHFHLTRLHLMFAYDVQWTYQHSPRLSDCLNHYKKSRADEVLQPPPLLQRGRITTTDIQKSSANVDVCKAGIKSWAKEVYQTWKAHHTTVDPIAQIFLAN